jgi:magnesium-transporting ATPase (P-type)
LILGGLAFRCHGVAVYPISPPAALYINTLAAGPPALALGVEPMAKDAIDIGPECFQKVFTASWYMDTIGYGVVIGAQTVANFVIVQYGVGNGAADMDPKVIQPLFHCPVYSLAWIALTSVTSLSLASSPDARLCLKLGGLLSRRCC